MRNFIFCLLLISLLISAGWSQDSTGRGRNKRLFVVPCPQQVTIDGKLNDWDLSGQIEIFIAPETRSTMNGRLAFMYDKDALYVSGVVQDDSPMINRHDPVADPGRAWDGDCFQLRMMLDPAAGFPLEVSGYNDQLCHMMLWYYTGSQQPCLQLAYGMNYQGPKAGYPGGVVPADKFQGAYRMFDDKRGYTFEYRIPWSTLEAKKTPVVGDLLTSVLQIQWGSADGLSIVGGGAAYDLMSRSGFPFQGTYCWGKALFTDHGKLPAAFSQPGDDIAIAPSTPLKFHYVLPETSEVTIALQDKNGKDVRRLISQAARKKGDVIEAWDGLDDNGKPLPAGDYTWRGLYHQPITTKYVMGVNNSGHPTWVTADGKGSWGADHGTPTTVAALSDSMILAWNVAENKGGLLRVDLNGHKQWGMLHSAIYIATDGKRLFTSGGTGFIDGSGVQVFDVTDSRPMNFSRGTAKVEEPSGGDKETNTVTGLAYGNGMLYVAYKKRNMICLYDPIKGSIIEQWTVPAPQQMTVSPNGPLLVVSQEKIVSASKNGITPLINNHLDIPTGITTDNTGNIYVANGGKTQNVSVFTATGKYLNSIGKTGGRPAVGRYDKTGMLEPGGIAIDIRGRLWVAETLDSPKRISVWDTKHGTCLNEFFGGGHYATFVSMDPSREDEAYCDMTTYKINTKNGTWSPKNTMWRATQPNMIDGTGWLRVLTAKDKSQYAWGSSHIGSVLYRRTGELFKPIVAVINVVKGNQFIAWPPYPIFDDNTKYPNGNYFWQDTNDDQIIQADEITLSKTFSSFGALDANLNLYCPGAMLPLASTGKDGRPIYDLPKASKTGIAGSHEFGGLHHDTMDDTLYTVQSDGGLTRLTPGGKALWTYPTKSWRASLNLPVGSKGNLWGVTSFLGTAGDFTGIASYFGPFNIITRDGMYISRLFRDQREGVMGSDLIMCEAFAGQMVKMQKSGRYFFLGGDTDGRISEIFGLNTVKRLPDGKLTITPADVAVANAALEEFGRRKAQAQPLFIERGKGSLSVAQGITRVVDEKRRFTARAAYDQQKLYINYDVTTPFELTNNITDPLIIFKGGNLIDVQLAADPNADAKRVKPAIGDLRLLITRQNGKPLAILYRPKVKDFTGEAKVLKSPTGQETFDSIEVVSQVTLEYSKTPAGFTATAIIPLSLLGWSPKSTASVRMDLGYLFGNETGSVCGLRAYWANNSPTAAINNDIPSESRLEPSQWGTALIE
ncbi:MAG: FlgD immunoglobulin-like domain containing protein [bacterium]